MCLGKDMNMKNASVVPVLTRGRDPERTIKCYPHTHTHRHLSLYQVGREKKRKELLEALNCDEIGSEWYVTGHWGHSLLRFFSFLLHNHTNVFVVFLNLFSAFIWWAIWISSLELPSYWVESTNFMISTTNLLSVLFYQKILYFTKKIMINFIYHILRFELISIKFMTFQNWLIFVLKTNLILKRVKKKWLTNLMVFRN